MCLKSIFLFLQPSSMCKNIVVFRSLRIMTLRKLSCDLCRSINFSCLPYVFLTTLHHEVSLFLFSLPNNLIPQKYLK